jgi:hypothetical protein
MYKSTASILLAVLISSPGALALDGGNGEVFYGEDMSKHNFEHAEEVFEEQHMDLQDQDSLHFMQGFLKESINLSKDKESLEKEDDLKLTNPTAFENSKELIYRPI